MKSAGAWSFSKIKSFETCPKQFYHVTVLNEFPFKETEATRYGNEFHKACEEFIRDGLPVPEKFAFIRPTLEKLAALPGEKHCEKKMGLTRDLQPCTFFDRNVWFRGIADLLIIDGDEAKVLDYKTGKSAQYAEKGQLELMALAVFKHFPQVRKVNGALLFVIAKELIKQSYVVDKQNEMWGPWFQKYAALDLAYKNDVWNPKPSGLCRKHCPVTQCPHNGANQ